MNGAASGGPEAVQLPPQALEAERALLGSCLIDPQAVERAADVVEEKDFYQEAHRKVFYAIRELFRRGGATDIIGVSEELRRLKWLDDVGGAELLSALTNRVATSAHVEYYANLVRDKSILRELINAATNIVGSCYREEKEPNVLLDEAQGSILKVSEKQKLHNVIHAKDLVHEVIEQMEAAHRNKNPVTGVPSGLAALDKITAGFQKSDLILIAARPSMGKTALGLNIASNVVLARKPSPVLFFSLEMSRHSIMQRLISSEARINLKDVRTGFFERKHWTNLTDAAAKFTEAPLYIVDTSGLSVLNVRSLARQWKSEITSKGLEPGLIVIDYLQLMRGPSSRSENRQQEVSDISRGLKFMARDLNVPVVALSQLSRAADGKDRADRKPVLSDLRESGALEQDADLVMMIYREGYYKREDPTLQNQAEIIVAKQRQGPLGIAKVNFFSNLTRFVDATRDEEPADVQEAETTFS